MTRSGPLKRNAAKLVKWLRSGAGLSRSGCKAKRSAALARRSQLSPVPLGLGKPARRAGMRRRSAKREAEQRLWNSKARAAILDNAGACAGRVPGFCLGPATDGHHWLPKGRGGPSTRANCLPLCRGCHSWVGDHTAEAERRGLLLRRSDPRAVAILAEAKGVETR